MATSGALTRDVSIWVIPGLKALSLSLFYSETLCTPFFALLSSKRKGELQAQSRSIL
jgi:hypothetical protein